MKKRATQIVSEMEEYLQGNYNTENGANNADYRPYIAVYLPKSEDKDLLEQVGSIAVELKKLIRHPMRTIENISGMNEPEIFEHEFQSYLVKERQIFDRLSRRLKITRGTPMTTEWLIKRNFWWGLQTLVCGQQMNNIGLRKN